MKIFGIGLSKTGTNSLCDALRILGYDMLHYPPEDIVAAVEQCDGCADLPTCAHFRTLDKEFPDSKFILTVRNKEKWLDSVEKHFRRRPPSTLSEWGKENRVEVYGSLYPTREDFARVYDKYHVAVFSYFKSRPDQLLRLNITDEEDGRVTWTKLCEFIEREVPDMADFPHGNAEPTQSEAIDVVVPYIHREGTWDSLKYAVRAACQNFVDMSDLWLVGDKPAWANDRVKVIPKEVQYERLDRARNFNYCNSMLLAAMCPEISEEFLYMADDHYILVPRTAQNMRDTVLVRENLAAYTQEDRRTARSGWQQMIWATADKLMDAGLSAWNFETHTPKMVTRPQLLATLAYFGYGDGNLIWQTAYFNLCPPANRNAKLSEETELKAGFYEPAEMEDIVQRSDAAIYLNHNDEGENDALRAYIESRFPEPSPYEA